MSIVAKKAAARAVGISVQALNGYIRDGALTEYRLPGRPREAYVSEEEARAEYARRQAAQKTTRSA